MKNIIKKIFEIVLQGGVAVTWGILISLLLPKELSALVLGIVIIIFIFLLLKKKKNKDFWNKIRLAYIITPFILPVVLAVQMYVHSQQTNSDLYIIVLLITETAFITIAAVGVVISSLYLNKFK